MRSPWSTFTASHLCGRDDLCAAHIPPVATPMRVEEKSGRHPLAWIEAVAYVSDRRG
jgi:hypothetical protein